MKIKALTILIISACLIAGVSRADVLFSDDFEYAVSATITLPEVNPSWSTTPWGTSGNNVKLVSWVPDKAYFSNSTWGDNTMKLAHTNVGTGDYTVKVDAYRYNETYKMEWYAAGRITESTYIAAGAVVGSGHVYVRLIDSTGYASGDYWLAVWDPALPIKIELSVQGDQVVATYTHAGLTQQLGYTTGIINAGDAGFGGKNPWSYVLGLFDNFVVEGVLYMPQGDLNGDRKVDLADLALLAADWAKCTDPADAACDQFWK